MQAEPAAPESFLVPFLAAAAAAAVATAALAVLAWRRRNEHRRIAAALGALGGHSPDPVRGARNAAGQAIRLDNALAELRAILETAPTGIIALDEPDRIVTINPAASRLVSGSGRPAEGRLLVEVVRSPPRRGGAEP